VVNVVCHSSPYRTVREGLESVGRTSPGAVLTLTHSGRLAEASLQARRRTIEAIATRWGERNYEPDCAARLPHQPVPRASKGVSYARPNPLGGRNSAGTTSLPGVT
jgi:hypothetical protein